MTETETCVNRATQLMDAARRQTGLECFGEDDFREGLERLIASLDSEARLNNAGRAMIDGMIVMLLSQRLQIEDWFARHPEIEEEVIVRPLVGVGLPRTGSTALACLLGEDPHARSLCTWETMAPCPPPEAATWAIDPRIAQTEVHLAERAKSSPRMTSMLPVTATSPNECQTFMAYSFKAQLFQGMAVVPSYLDWLYHQADMAPTYRYVKKVLKLLQWRCPTARWRIKNPSHLNFITAFDEVFPDAQFVMTHRDPAAVIWSVCDLHLESCIPNSDSLDPRELGQLNTECWELGVRRMIEFRDAGADDRFFDIHFEPFQRDPISVIARLYDWLGEEFTPEARANMEAWRRNTPRDTGYERTPMEVFGLDGDRLHERFRFYSERFPPQPGS